jgi:hypothetical protein
MSAPLDTLEPSSEDLREWLSEFFVDKSEPNGSALVVALRELGFELSEDQATEIRRGKDFVQLKSGPFDLDLAKGSVPVAAGAREHLERGVSRQ